MPRTALKNNLGPILDLILIGGLLYAFNLRGPLFWDDADWIVNNPVLHALTWANIKFIFSHDVLAGISQVSNYYRPFLFLTFLFNYLISGSSPVSYHFISDAIHIVNAVLLFYLISRWLGSRRAAFITALLFLIQPLQTESVAYVSGRGDPLAVMLMLAGIILYLNNHRWWAGLAAILAVLSRETAVLFPLYLALSLVAFEYAGSFWGRIKKSIIAVWPYLGISVVYGVLRLTVLNFNNTLNFYSQANVYSQHLSVRIYTFLHVLLIYLRLMVWPTGLHMDRDVAISLSPWHGWAWLGGLVIIALMTLLVWLYRKKSASFSIWLWGTGIFFIALGPTSGIVPINARIYEHWLYFSLAGTALIAGFYLDKLFVYLENKKPSLKPALVIALLAYCLFLGVQTIRRNLLWSDVEGLYKNILYYEPNDVRVLNNLGNWYSDHGDDADAQPLYERAIASDPTQAAPYYNIGNIFREQGDPAAAIQWYQKAIVVDPKFYYAYNNIAAIYLNQNKVAEALAILEKLQTVSPSDLNAQRIELLKKHL